MALRQPETAAEFLTTATVRGEKYRNVLHLTSVQLLARLLIPIGVANPGTHRDRFLGRRANSARVVS